MNAQKSPWLALALGTAGLVVGYGVVILTGPSAFASAKSCPYSGHSTVTCTGADCPNHG